MLSVHKQALTASYIDPFLSLIESNNPASGQSNLNVVIPLRVEKIAFFY
jgi:hypothetical protein